MRRTAFVVPLLLVGVVVAQTPHKVPEDADILRSAGITPTPDGLVQYLTKQVTGPEKPLSDADADALIAKLGSDDFDVREATMKELSARRNLPIARLQAALKHADLEVRTRAQEILDQASRRADPVAAVLRVARAQKARIAPATVLALVDQAATTSTREAGIALLVSQAQAEDAALARKWLTSARPGIQAAGLRVLAAVEKDRAIPLLREHLTKPGRLAAARALLDLGAEVDVLQAAKDAPAEEAVFLLLAAETRLRFDYKDRRKDEKAMRHYGQVAEGLVITLGKVEGVKFEDRPAMNTQYYLEQHLDTSKHPEILFYQVQWFAGHWSGWLAPGFNDRMDDERKIRCWACFNDHNNKVITTTRRDLFRQILDLDQP